eukprot:COSAG01_NODE_38472_length_489_cov_0.774359_1_plen_100_part_00
MQPSPPLVADLVDVLHLSRSCRHYAAAVSFTEDGGVLHALFSITDAAHKTVASGYRRDDLALCLLHGYVSCILFAQLDLAIHDAGEGFLSTPVPFGMYH